MKMKIGPIWKICSSATDFYPVGANILKEATMSIKIYRISQADKS